MKLNRNSWHARWYRYAKQKELPDNLCEYFLYWLAMILLLGLISLASILFGVKFYQDWPESGIGVLFTFLLCFFIFAIVWFANTDATKIIRAYLKARKERYCPRIEWEE